MHRFRVRRFKVRAGKMEDEDGIEDRSMSYQRLLHELYLVQRRAWSSCATAARSATR